MNEERDTRQTMDDTLMGVIQSKQRDEEEDEAPTEATLYRLHVDSRRNYRAVEILLCDLSRPHMRAFHTAWWSFFVGFVLWFSVSPIVSDIQDTQELTSDEVWISSLVGIAGTVATRLIVGPLCHTIGPRRLTTIMLAGASIATSLTGLVNGANGLMVLRLFVGVAAGTFVTCQYWMTRMFTHEIIGTATAIAGGWGNLGAVVTQLFVRNTLRPLFLHMTQQRVEPMWRTMCIIPAVVGIATAVVTYWNSDDDPTHRRNKTRYPPSTALTVAWRATRNINTWILAFQYAGCFGVELTMQTAAANYFIDNFNQNEESAFALAAVFGWMNLFARGIGGYASDKLHTRYGMRGRLFMLMILLSFESISAVTFAQTTRLSFAVGSMLIFSFFVQAAEGATFAIVPYVDPPSTGAVMGIVGAGGSAGAIVFSVAFRKMHYDTAFLFMSLTMIASSILTFFICIRDYSSLIRGNVEGVETTTTHDILFLDEGTESQTPTEHAETTQQSP